jgi:hypothetical protein
MPRISKIAFIEHSENCFLVVYLATALANSIQIKKPRVVADAGPDFNSADHLSWSAL